MLLFRQVILQYKDGPKVRVPEGLLQEADNGQQYLRFRPSSTSLTRALLGHMGNFKTLKNPSLSCSPQVSQLREAVKAKILKMASKEPADGGDRENLFTAQPAGDEEDHGNEVTSRKLREVLERAPDVLQIELAGKPVEVLKPRSWRETDILIKLAVSDLEHVFDFLMLDIDSVFDKAKRSYVRSGKYVGGKRKAEDEDKQSLSE